MCPYEGELKVCVRCRVHCHFPHSSLISSLFTELSSSLSLLSSPADSRKFFWMVLSELILGYRSEWSRFCLHPDQEIQSHSSLSCSGLQRTISPALILKLVLLGGKNSSSLKSSQISFPFLKYFLCFHNKSKKKAESQENINLYADLYRCSCFFEKNNEVARKVSESYLISIRFTKRILVLLENFFLNYRNICLKWLVTIMSYNRECDCKEQPTPAILWAAFVMVVPFIYYTQGV